MVGMLSYSFPEPANSTKEIVVRGRILCLDDSGQNQIAETDCGKPKTRFGLKTVEEKIYLFSPDDAMIGMFFDPAVRQKDLQIKGRLHPNNVIEIIKIHSIHEGKLYDIFYYCDVCAITSYEFGLCYCCQQPTDLRETPAP